MLCDFLREDHIHWQSVALDQGQAIPDLADYDALLVLGGPMDVWQEAHHPWLVAEKAALRAAIAQGLPTLGLCLGHQLLAAALGGEVAGMSAPGLGMAPVLLTPAGQESALLRGLNDFSALYWHGAEVVTLPTGATVLARSASGGIQATQYASRAFGVQCHVEITSDMITQWLAIPDYQRFLVKASVSPDELLRAVQAAQGELRRCARRVYDNFLSLARQRAKDREGCAGRAPEVLGP